MNGRELCIFGEVLFDHFPDRSRVLGGAPFNVAWHLQAFGQSPRFISRVGDDPEGELVRAAMLDWGMPTDDLQIDSQLPTGRVDVRLVDNEPHYDIVHPCAYDRIEPGTRPAACGLVYHGSLALRSDASRQAAAAIRDNSDALIFVDVNLRPPWWQVDEVRGMLVGADWVKLNADELRLLQPGADAGSAAADFRDRYALRGLIVTQGAEGARILTAEGAEYFARPEAGIELVDTVGAGDAFASVTILGLLRDWPLDLTLQRAQQFASRIVSRRGATVADREFYRPLVESWGLSA